MLLGSKVRAAGGEGGTVQWDGERPRPNGARQSRERGGDSRRDDCGRLTRSLSSWLGLTGPSAGSSPLYREKRRFRADVTRFCRALVQVRSETDMSLTALSNWALE